MFKRIYVWFVCVCVVMDMDMDMIPPLQDTTRRKFAQENDC
jgi:hypothetical protein